MSSTSSSSSSSPEVAVVFFAVSLVIGAACRQILKNTRIPYTVALLVIGVGLGALSFNAPNSLGYLGESIQMWSNINPNLILYVFLPALLFESSFAFEFHQIKRCLLQMFLLAGPGVALSTLLLGLVDKLILPYNFNWSTSFLLGGLLSATDPVAVVALLKDLGASKKLTTLIDGEALMNDGTAIVVFQLFFGILFGDSATPGSIVVFLLRVTLGTVALGIAFGIVSVLWVQTVFNDYVIEITLTLAAAYISFYVANDVVNMSGVLSVMTVGIFFAIFAKTALTGESEVSMTHFWEMVTYVANTLIFILAGVVISESYLKNQSQITGRDWVYVLVLYLLMQLSRVIVVLAMYPGLASSGYGFDWKESLITIWAGLRGAVALSLSLIVYHKQDGVHITSITATRVLFLTGGVTFLSLVINGSTTQFLLSALGMAATSDTKKRILEYTHYEMYQRARTAFEEFGEDDDDLGTADWMTVRKYLGFLDLPGASVSASQLSDGGSHLLRRISEYDLHVQQIQDVRLRFLNGVQAAYWTMLEDGRVTQGTALLLMQSVEEAIDTANKEHRLAVWTGLKPHVTMPFYLRLLRRIPRAVLSDALLSSLLVRRLELGASIAASFLRAQRHAREQLGQFMGTGEVVGLILAESLAEEKEAEQYLEELRATVPQVLQVIKTKQVTYAILQQLQHYVDSLAGAGLLDAKETIHLREKVQKDLKMLIRRPPLVLMPSASEILSLHPFVAALPEAVHTAFITGAKQLTKLKGSRLLKKGVRAEGVWLLVAGSVLQDAGDGAEAEMARLDLGGIVRATSVTSCIGLYEVLSGLACLSNVTAATVVNCFFVESQRVLDAFRNSPSVQQFMWKESAVMIAKLLLPAQLFSQNLAGLRGVVLSGSSRLLQVETGSELTLKPNDAGILLQGSVLQRERATPAVAPQGLLGGEESATFTCESACILVVFELPSAADVEQKDGPKGLSDRAQSTSLQSRSHDHDGLLRWGPQTASQLKQRQEEDQAMAANTMVARALSAPSSATDLNGSGEVQKAAEMEKFFADVALNVLTDREESESRRGSKKRFFGLNS